MTAQAAIARFSAGFGWDDLPEPLRRTCLRALIDTVAVGIAGRCEPAVDAALRYATRLGAGGSAGLWGDTRRLPVESAALCNGIAAHVLDYDDVTLPLSGHPSVALLPALMALGEAVDASGQRLLTAHAVGFEVICRLARGLNPAHYRRGWHATASLGTMACAVACAHLLGLDETGTRHAIGLAVAQSAGTRTNFGTDAKSFQAGQCNAAGLRSALLAAEGFTASDDALSADIGFASLYGEGLSLDAFFADIGQVPLELQRSGIEVKKYPLCYGTHRTLDGLLDLRAEHGLRLDQVAEVRVRTSLGQLVPLIHHRPRTGLEAKFSMEYAVACALHDGAVRLASFTDEAVRRAPLQAFFDEVHTSSPADGAVNPRWAEITLLLRDGRSLHKRIDALRGSAALPLTDQELFDKTVDCLAFGASAVTAESLVGAAHALPQGRVRDFAAALASTR